MNAEIENTVVSVKNLEKRFGDFIAVNQISLSVQRGEIFGFLGPNGAGKSTTIRMLPHHVNYPPAVFIKQ